MISGTMKPASANLSMIDVTSSIRIQSTKKRLYDNVKLYLGEGGGKEQCDPERGRQVGDGRRKFKVWSTRAVGGPE